ncbi:MAG TPA: hypothetical protein VMJ75_11565 [Candidatus Acidoferrales bacterium]|nr:hypothetical protein [Candidatus Acidoferrales bacterium]
MNELEFKRHLKDLVQGRHHPEEHDWGARPEGPRKSGAKSVAKRQPRRKTSKRK